MTPASIGKLAIRLAAAVFVVQASVPQTGVLVRGWASASQLGGNRSDQLSFAAFSLLIVLILTLAPIAVWWRAAWLGQFLLPRGADRAQSSDYQVWEEVGLMFVGALALWHGLKSLAMSIFGWVISIGSPGMATTYLVVAVLLFSGPALLRRLFTRPNRAD